MKLPSRYDVGIALLVFTCVCFVVARWAWKEAYRGGFPFFSFATLEAIWPGLALLAVGLLAAMLPDRDSK